MSNIYGKYNSYGEIYEEVKKLEDEKRFKHTMGVVEVAVELAVKYGYDLEKAKLAALLHDCAKNFEVDFREKFIKENNIDISKYDDFENLKHGPVGAYYSKVVFGIDDEEIFNAVYYHSTGRVKMTTLDKIIFLADFLDPGRDRRGYEEVANRARELSYTNLDEGVKYILARTILYLQTNFPDNICDDTRKTYEYYNNLSKKDL